MILQISTNQLSLGEGGDDVARVHQALQALGRRVPVSETASRVLGTGTVAVLKALQTELGLTATGIVDAATVRAINVLLADLATERRVIRGAVRDASGSPFTDGFVQLFGHGPSGEQILGKSPLRTGDGSYQISYQPPFGSNGRLDLRVAVLNDRGLLDTTPSGASLLTNAGPLEVVNFVLSGEAHQPSSEFELMLGDLKPLLGDRALADLTEDANRRDVSLLASQSGYASDQIAALVLAHKLAKETRTPAQVCYGMLRQGLPVDAFALHSVHRDARRKALKAAVAHGMVRPEIDGKKIEAYLNDFVPAPAEQVQELLGQMLNADELNLFVGQYLKSGQDIDAFWRQIAADPAWANRAEDLKFIVQLGALTNNHVPLVAAVRALPGMTRAADVVRLTEEEWTALIQTPGVGVPDDTPGADADEKTNTCVKQIVAQVEAAFPTQFFAERLGTSPVATFLKAQPSYDLRTTYPEQFFKRNPAAAQSLSPQDRQQLASFQRLHRLTGSAKETLALAARGIHSAQQITRIDRTRFAEQHKEIFSVERADAIYNRAQRTHALALALFADHAAGLNRTGLHVLPKVNSQKQAELAADSIPDWQTLFGTVDFCACDECASVHGPVAYFVDILHFLGERNALAPLFDRRPDLGDIELSCDNANTPLPLIDLVNEVLENAVAPPQPFAPLTLAPALETDLAQPVATAALAAAFSPPLQSGARVETLESGKRWRVWDERFAYSIVKEDAALTVVARSRQTTGSAAERRATPQYRNSVAYAELSQAVYPWTLPFDLPFEEAKVFLTHLGVSRHALIESLRPTPDPFDLNSPVVIRLAAERLGLTDTERKIIVGEPLTPPRPPEDFWGAAPVALLATVQELLDRSGLSYRELEALITTWFINPINALTITAEPGAPVDTCDPTKLQINGLTADVLSRIHRFVRLWRKLGWTIPDVDRAIHTLVSDPSTPALTNDLLVRLDHLRRLASGLRLSVPQTLALWKPIDTTEPGSLYRSLFDNPAVFKPQDEDFRLRPDGQELVHTDTLLADHAAALQAAFRLNAAGFAHLLAKTDGKLNLANLSLIYRHATLARQLGLTVPDLLTAIELTGLDPFRADRSQETLRFVEVVKAIRSSGFDVPQLDYFIRHRFNPAASFVPMDSTLAQALTEVRSDLLKIGASSDAEQEKLQQSAVIDRVSAALGVSPDVTGVLLSRVTHGGVTAQQRFLDLSVIEAEFLSRDNAQPQFETIEKLLKIATILQTLQLPGSQLDWLFRENAWLTVAPDPLANPVPFADWFSLIQLQHLRRDLPLEDAGLEAILSAINTVAVAADQPARRVAKLAFREALSEWLGWSPDDLDTLIGKSDNLGDLGLLKARIPDDYRIDLVVRLHRAMSVLKRLGVAAAQANQWCDSVVTDANAKAIRGAAKAKYDDDTWQELAAPLQDSLRDKQREALLRYLVAHPAPWMASAGKADANALYSHFLIDVEMSSCQLTSRIKQAIGSVQLFAQRCLMGFEPGVQLDDPKWIQWNWMKNFRVWEANRKIWLYPENWIEPELRDDKTPFFEDLENELRQSDLTDAAAEQALLRYLEKLDEVARLEIVGVYEDDERKDVHVFGRTFHTPHVYYYRRRDGATDAWLPWAKVELDIEGDHLIPVRWNRKLMLIWPIFTEKAQPTPVVMPEPGHKLDSADRYWEIQLAWSEYQNGRWTGKNLSEAVTFTAYQGEDPVLFGPRVAAPQNTAVTLRMYKDDGGFRPEGGDGPEVDPGGAVPPRTNGSTAPRRLVSKERFSFKALDFGETLVVRGFLRRDYRETPDAGDVQITCCFGEFRFFGCRKIVTTAHRAKITGLNFPLAPSGTTFDHMWFTARSSGLTLFDGTFPVARPRPDVTIFTDVNEPASIAGDASSTLVNKLDIPALARTPSPFRLLAPHQDLQFVCDRPFFFMDSQRAFMVTSTGSSAKTSRPDFSNWVNADLAIAWRADYFPPPAPTTGPVISTDPSPAALQPLTVLARGPRGERVAKLMVPVNLQPDFRPRTLLPTFRTTRQYRFANFYHPYLCEFVKTLDRHGIPALLSLDTQNTMDEQSFEVYQPEPRVRREHPVDEVEFQSNSAYAVYNWELFFHIPLLIADRLSKNQRFEEAQRWFHFIFDPTGASGGTVPQRYWRTKPFHDRLSGDYETESVKTIEEMSANGPSEALKVAVRAWRNDPFSPHAIARLRTTAYQKTVVMKYIANLIAWGDQLFRRETLESINEATQLYVLAAEILGRRPEVIQRNRKPPVETFKSLEPKLGVLSNALAQIELLVADVGDESTTGDSLPTPDLPSNTVLYFCVPDNDSLLAYWNTTADRLFKIRHCMNIEGQVRHLPLFEPPIDPALLVRAQTAGLRISDVLSEISVPLPTYRFSVMVQQANELAAEVRNLGAALLAALEKRDAEALSTLRSGQDLRLLQAVRDIRTKQIAEAEASIASLEASRQMVQARKEYYESRDFLSDGERLSLSRSTRSLQSLEASAALRALVVILQKFGVFKFGSLTTMGPEQGPAWLGHGMQTAASGADVMANIFSVSSHLAGRMAEYERRRDEWDHQERLATIELKQIDQQLTAAQLRLAVAEQELRNHDQQIDNARDVDRFLRSKFTNQDLYQWMVGQVSGLYFQSYQLAYDLAKRAEQCLRFELGLPDSHYISFGYWDSLKKGLLAGERLQYDLRRLETAYLEHNRREFELTKHISLAQLDPLALVKLRETGRCFFRLPEEIFDLDFPGHYFRRIKSVGLTLPCVVGPYTTIACTLRLLKNSIRVSTADGNNGYARNTDDQGMSTEDGRFVENTVPVKAMAASSAQNDSGMFELSFRDERYLPFEGAGAVSEWSLELFSDLPSNNPDFGKPLRQFDYGSISDAVLHVRYSAREDAGAFKSGTIAYLRDYFSQDKTTHSMQMLNLRQEFPTQWHRFLHPASPANDHIFELEMSSDVFPLRDQGKTLTINTIWLLARCADEGSYDVVMTPPLPAPPVAGSNTITLARVNDSEYGGLHFGVKDSSAMAIQIVPKDPPVTWKLHLTRPGGDSADGPVEVEDLILVLGYEWN